MSTEPFDVTDLDQLSNIIVSVVVPLPDGREARVKLRALTPTEIYEVKRKMTRPTPPVKDYKKINGEAVPVYDYDDKTFADALNEYDADYSRRTLVASLVMNIAGDTIDEKCETLKNKLGQAAYILLINAVNRLGNPTTEDVARLMSSFQPDGFTGTSGNGQKVAYSIGVEKLTEERTRRDDGLSAGAKRKA